MNYNAAVAAMRIAHPNWNLAQIENAAHAVVLAGEKQAALEQLDALVASATDENGQFDWSNVGPQKRAWFDDANPDGDFMANVVIGLEANLAATKARGDAAELAEQRILENLRTGNIGPSQRGGRL
jgi:hypothetical protein